MSMKDLEDALEIVERDEDLGDFVGPRDEALVAQAERALGLRFPPTYRAFLLRLGAGSFGGAEFYGLVDDGWENSSVPDGIWLTLDERERSGLPPGTVIVAAVGDGSYHCLDARGPGEAKVVVFAPGAPRQAWEVDAEDFGAFMLREVRAAREDGQG